MLSYFSWWWLLKKDKANNYKGTRKILIKKIGLKDVVLALFTIAGAKIVPKLPTI